MTMVSMPKGFRLIGSITCTDLTATNVSEWFEIAYDDGLRVKGLEADQVEHLHRRNSNILGQII
jgi:hypothetical protein